MWLVRWSAPACVVTIATLRLLRPPLLLLFKRTSAGVKGVGHRRLVCKHTRGRTAHVDLLKWGEAEARWQVGEEGSGQGWGRGRGRGYLNVGVDFKGRTGVAAVDPEDRHGAIASDSEDATSGECG